MSDGPIEEEDDDFFNKNFVDDPDDRKSGWDNIWHYLGVFLLFIVFFIVYITLIHWNDGNYFTYGIIIGNILIFLGSIIWWANIPFQLLVYLINLIIVILMLCFKADYNNIYGILVFIAYLIVYWLILIFKVTVISFWLYDLFTNFIFWVSILGIIFGLIIFFLFWKFKKSLYQAISSFPNMLIEWMKSSAPASSAPATSAPTAPATSSRLSSVKLSFLDYLKRFKDNCENYEVIRIICNFIVLIVLYWYIFKII